MKKLSRYKVLWIALAALLILPFLMGGIGFFVLTHRVRGQFFDAEGTPIHYTVEGEGQPVILIHGFAANGDLNWRLPKVTQKLSKHFQVITMDLRGHGLSGKPHEPNSYGIEMVEDVVRLLDHLNIERAHVAGYSLGGFITLKLAAVYPDRLISASVLGAGWEAPDEATFFAALERFAQALEEGKGVGPLAEGLPGRKHKPGPLHTFWVRLMTKHFNDQQALVGVLRGLPALAITEEEVRAIQTPLCCIVGGQDVLSASADNLHALAPKASFTVIEGADHLRAPGRPEFYEALLTFLEAHSG